MVHILRGEKYSSNAQKTQSTLPSFFIWEWEGLYLTPVLAHATARIKLSEERDDPARLGLRRPSLPSHHLETGDGPRDDLDIPTYKHFRIFQYP